MAHIPQTVLDRQPVLQGLELRHRGKVRDSYNLPGHPDKMLVVASDRCSIFDFVLPTIIGEKGAILTALNHFWTTSVLQSICKTDFIAAGANIDCYLPGELQNNPELQKRATVVRIVAAPDVEDIVRLHLTGSGWTSYQGTGAVCGHQLLTGLVDGNKLPYPLYTPTTKAAEGHDEHITADSVANRYGVGRERMSLQVAGAISAHAEKRGIILADSKFEFGLYDGKLVLADEKGTPDSSRFWDATAWKKAQGKGKIPPSFDKQFVREWGKESLVEKDANGRKRDPENPADIAFVDDLKVPSSVTDMTTRIYRYIFWRLTGMKIETYQRTVMGINVENKKLRIEVLVGSESDLPQTETGLVELSLLANVHKSIISCHRNPVELRNLAKDSLREADVIIAGAGMAAALPGIVKSELCMLGHPEIPVIGVAFEGAIEEHNLAAELSIKCLPGQPVELDQNGEAYFGPEGFLAACNAAVRDEFLPKTIQAKPAQIGIQ